MKILQEEAKKKLLRGIPSGIYVVGVGMAPSRQGFTVSWLTQISMKPPKILLAVRLDSRSMEQFHEGCGVIVNYLKKDDKNIAEQFFKAPLEQEGSLGGFAIQEGYKGAPVLQDSLGYLECEVQKIIPDLGDHAGVIAEVRNAVIQVNEDPLVMADTSWSYGG
jgi:flavin reductase (DIM6/NTAB) family NADH-FMN oxidoreductase RutF